MPSSFKAFYKLQFIKCNHLLRPVDRPLQGERPSPPTPLSSSLCSQPSREGESGTMMLPWSSHHRGPQPKPASLASPCQGSTLHLAIGNRLFLPGAAIVCFSQTARLLHYFLQINEEFPSHGAQPGLTYNSWDRSLPA